MFPPPRSRIIMHATQSTLTNETLNHHPVCATKKAKFDHRTHARPACGHGAAHSHALPPTPPDPPPPCSLARSDPCAACELPAQNELTHVRQDARAGRGIKGCGGRSTPGCGARDAELVAQAGHDGPPPQPLRNRPDRRSGAATKGAADGSKRQTRRGGWSSRSNRARRRRTRCGGWRRAPAPSTWAWLPAAIVTTKKRRLASTSGLLRGPSGYQTHS